MNHDSWRIVDRGRRGVTTILINQGTALALAGTIILCAGSVAQTKAPAKPSLKETTAWMENFSSQHGFVTLNTGLMRTNVLRALKECAVSVEITYPNATKVGQIKKLTATIALSDFDPSTVRAETDKDAGTYEVDFERSDSSPGIEENTEMGDGKKGKMWTSQEILFFDSEESARRFAHALVNAINLCGGKPAPF